MSSRGQVTEHYIKAHQAGIDFLSLCPCWWSSECTLGIGHLWYELALTCSPCMSDLMKCFRSHFDRVGPEDWVMCRPVSCTAKERPGPLCFLSPHEASWPRIMLGRKFAFWCCWKVADTTFYIEDRSSITLLSLSSASSVSPSSVASL